ncbi:MAG: glycogen synthase [Chloroflexota bacterium]|jgi:glycosyltransferase involved in cell wall biosynthesis|nr:glycogen synthase [Chloroflexota bacterium]
MPDAALRVLVVTNNYPPHTLGGYELLAADHVAWLLAEGHHVTVLTSTYGVAGRRPTEDRGAAGERVVRALDFHWSNFRHRRPHGPCLWAGERRQRLVVEGLVREESPSVALTWGMAGISKSLLEVLRRAGLALPTVVGEHWPIWDIDADVWLRTWSPRANPVLRALRAPLRGWADREVAPTDVGAAVAAMVPAYMSSTLQREVEAGRPEWRGRGGAVPNGIRLEVFERLAPDDRPLGAPVRLLYIGRIEPRKGVHTAVEALPLLAAAGVPAELTIVGWAGDRYAEELRAVAARLGVAKSLRWREPVHRDAVADVYAAHDVLVFPTIWSEPFGLVPLEAMAAGCLVVGTGTGGSGDHVRDGETALRFAPEDAAGLAAAVARLVADPGLVARLRRAGHEEARAHDYPAYAERLRATLLL